MMAAVLVLAAAYRLPGVAWGFNVVDAAYYEHPHPDDGVVCFDAMEHGHSEITNPNNETERGFMAQCALLGKIFGPQSGIIPRAKIARTYSVLWGLLSILLTGLIARRLKGDVAGIFAALLLATAGVNLITSFWVRGQIQNVTYFLASIFVALRVRESTSKERAAIVLFVASALAGASLATRWSFALVPMVFGCAVARRPIWLKLGATVTGLLFGFFGSTGFFWTPALVQMNFQIQRGYHVMLYSRITPLVTASAMVVCIMAGTGLVTFVFALWFAGGRLRRLRHLRRDTFVWSNVRAALDSPPVIIGVPFLLTFMLISINKAFDARYTDLFAPPLAIGAAIALTELWERINKRWRILFAGLLAYQCIYAASMLARYVGGDSRSGMNVDLHQVWHPKGMVYATPYVSQSTIYAGYGVPAGKGPWDAEWFVISDVYAGQYLTPSGTFPFLGGPPNCREVLYCDSEQYRAFVQKVFAGDGWDLVHVAKAPAWTPEIKLHHALMTSKWMFTGNIRLFHKRPPG